MKYVNRIIGKDGVERLYLRKRGLPAIRLRSAWGTEELAREVEALVSDEGRRPIAGTLGLAARAYELESAEFRALRASTQREYRYVLREFEEDFGAVPIAAFQGPRILQLRDAWARRGHRAANIRLQILKNVLKPALIARQIPGGDPFAHVSLVRRPSTAQEPHLLWPEEAVRTVIEAAIQEHRHGLARAVAIARYAGVRRGDLVRLTESNRSEGRIRFRSGKRKVLVDIPEDAELTRWLEATPAAARNANLEPPHLVYGVRSPRYTEDGLALELRKFLARLARQGKLHAKDYDLHGLRHTRGVELALAGCTDAQGAAQMGHSSPSSFAQYRRQADRLRMADDAARLVIRRREAEPTKFGAET